jgi:hypothetical protein
LGSGIFIEHAGADKDSSNYFEGQGIPAMDILEGPSWATHFIGHRCLLRI